MNDNADNVQPEQVELGQWLVGQMADLATAVGESCLDELPRHLKFREKLKPGEIRRETMVAILYSTKLCLTDAFGEELAAEVDVAIRKDFVAKCLQGDIGEFSNLDDLLANRFQRYVKARNDPMAKDEMLRDMMMGIVAACSLGLEDKPRMQFATHLGAHVSMWRRAVQEALSQEE